MRPDLRDGGCRGTAAKELHRGQAILVDAALTGTDGHRAGYIVTCGRPPDASARSVCPHQADIAQAARPVEPVEPDGAF